WFPDEHPPAPRSVKGPMPNACGSCHLMSGQGHTESADLAGMPAEYIIRQMRYFKSGARSEETRMGPIARAVSDEDVREAAADFAAITPAPFVNVIEAATPPEPYVSADGGPAAGLHRAAAPDDAERHERRRQRGADEKGRRESVGRRHHRPLRVPGIASAASANPLGVRVRDGAVRERACIDDRRDAGR